jgi:hypothetical protein
MRSSRARVLVALLAAVALATWLAAAALGAEPSASPEPGVGDPRSSGQGPGLVGEPGVAIAVVVGVGLLALGVTLLYVRLTGGPRDPA